MKAVDLHAHSNKSDGSMSPAELTAYAAKKGLRAYALTDHDTIEGLAEAIEAAKTYPDLEVIPGIEFSTEYKGRDIHIVGLYIRYDDPEFLEELTKFQNSRKTRNEKMCNNLSVAGIDITFEKLQAEFPDSVITRAHYARYLLSHGYVKSLPEAFDRYVGDHTKYFVPRQKVTPVEAIRLILQAGGIPILAHPVLYHMSATALEELVAQLTQAGLIGMECIYSTYSPSEEREMKRLADKYRLAYSGGSDYHGKAKPGLELGTGYGKLFVPEEILDRLIAKWKPAKILFTDLDGTLLNDQKTISQTVKEELYHMHEKGHTLVFTTGRPLTSVLEVQSSLDLEFPDSYIIAYNGSLVYHCDSKTPVIEHTISRTDVEIIMNEARALGIHCHSYEDDCIIYERETEELAYYRQHIHLPFRIVDDIPSALFKDPYKLIAIHLENRALLEALKERVLSKLSDRISAVYSNDYYLEFYPINSGKGNAIRDLCTYLNIPISNSAAIGDEYNDISMIKAAGLGCAMQNAKEEVKKVADFVTTHDNNHDGICDLLSFFFL